MSQDADTVRAVTALFNHYVEVMDRDDIEAALDVFAIPCTLTSFGRVLYVDSRQTFLNHWGNTMRGLRQQGVTHGTLGGVKVFPLDGDTALAGVIFERRRPGGELFNRSCGCYHLFKFPSGWKVVSFIMHDPEKWIGKLQRVDA